jgi:hypothetical protein
VKQNRLQEKVTHDAPKMPVTFCSVDVKLRFKHFEIREIDSLLVGFEVLTAVSTKMTVCWVAANRPDDGGSKDP